MPPPRRQGRNCHSCITTNQLTRSSQVVVANDSLNLLGAVVGGLVGSTSGLGPRAVLAGAAVGAALAMLMAVTGRRYTYVSRYGARTAGDARRAARLFGWLPGGGLRLPGAGLLPPFRF